MKALSMRQPWAWLVVKGIKSMEMRTWGTRYRGSLLIHASGKWDLGSSTVMGTIRKSHLVSPFKLANGNDNVNGYKYTGGIVGMVDLTGIKVFNAAYEIKEARRQHLVPGLEAMANHYNFIGWEFIHAQQFDEPIPCKGALRLWTPPQEVINEVKEQLECVS